MPDLEEPVGPTKEVLDEIAQDKVTVGRKENTEIHDHLCRRVTYINYALRNKKYAITEGSLCIHLLDISPTRNPRLDDVINRSIQTWFLNAGWEDVRAMDNVVYLTPPSSVKSTPVEELPITPPSFWWHKLFKFWS